MNKRTLPALVLSLGITITLVLAMYLLIKMKEPELSSSTSFKLPSITADIQETDLQTITVKPQKPEDAQEQPELPEPEIQVSQQIDSNIQLGAAKLGINKSFKGFNSNDGDYLPIFRAPPIYPRRAQERGLCGWVELTYTVTAQGGVRDPIVIESSSKMFERAAVKAALKYKYKPRQEGGKPVDVPNVGIRVLFELDEGC